MNTTNASDPNHTHKVTPPTTDIWGAAVYIERDGARRIASVEAAREGLSMFHGRMNGGCYSFTVRNEDIPALDAARDRAYSKFRSPKAR